MTADGFLARKKIDDPDFGGNLRLLYKKQDNNCEHRISSISIAITTTNETTECYYCHCHKCLSARDTSLF